MTSPRQVCGRQSIVDFHNRLLHRNLFDHRTCEVEVLAGEDEDGLLGDVVVGEAILKEEIADVSHHAEAKGLLAGDEGEGSGEVLNHEVRRGAHLGLVSFHREILHRQLASRDACNRDRTFDNWSDNLADSAIDRNTDETTERVVGGEECELWVEDDEIGEGLESGRDGVCGARRV